MTLQVELGAIGGFTLDDPVRGVLDNITYRLGGVQFEDVTDFVAECAITRGKNRDLNRFGAGRVNLRLRNQGRQFDPSYENAQFAAYIKPRQPIRISFGAERLFTGLVSDWNFDYDVDGQSIAEVVSVDDFTLLAQQELVEGTAVPQTTGERVSAILNREEVEWAADKRNIDVGESELGADVFSGNVLRYLQKVEASEQGQLFIARDGDLQFRSRTDATPTSDTFVALADDGTGIQFTAVEMNFGTELLFNRATITGPTGTVIANNSPSQQQYGITEFDADVLVDSTDQLTNLALFVVEKFGEPELRFEAVKISFDDITAGQRETLSGLELGDVVKMTFTPNNVGGDDPIVQFGQIIRLDHDIQLTSHDMIIGVASLAFNSLVLDDAVFGKLNTGHLAF